MLEVIKDVKPSERSIDDNGYMRIAKTPISKAMVNPYRGKELQGLTTKELDPDRLYYGLRDPKELEKGASSFNGLFLLDEHHDIDAITIPKEYIVGTVGTDAEFKDGYLYNSLVIADKEAIEAVKDKSKWEISCAYKFEPDFTEGEYEAPDGQKIHYDFIMRNIKGNHVALVPEGRAGHDVRVADSAEGVQMEEEIKIEKKILMQAVEVNDWFMMAGIYRFDQIKDAVKNCQMYDIKYFDDKKDDVGKIVGVTLQSGNNYFSIAYDQYGKLEAHNVINDDVACMVRNAIQTAQQKEMCEKVEKDIIKEEAKEEAKQEVAVGVSEGIKVLQEAEVLSKPEKGDVGAEPLGSADSEPLTMKIGEPIETGKVDVVVVGDEDVNVAETPFALKDTRYYNIDEMKNEIKKFGLCTGLVKVNSESGLCTLEADKGEDTYQFVFKQYDNYMDIVDVTVVKDEIEETPNMIETKEEVAVDAEGGNALVQVGAQMIESNAGVPNLNIKQQKAQEKHKMAVKHIRNVEEVEDGGPGSGRKPGSKNGMSNSWTKQADVRNAKAKIHNLSGQYFKSYKERKRRPEAGISGKYIKAGKLQNSALASGNSAAKAMHNAVRNSPEKTKEYGKFLKKINSMPQPKYNSANKKFNAVDCKVIGDAKIPMVSVYDLLVGILNAPFEDDYVKDTVCDGGPGSGRKPGSKNGMSNSWTKQGQARKLDGQIRNAYSVNRKRKLSAKENRTYEEATKKADKMIGRKPGFNAENRHAMFRADRLLNKRINAVDKKPKNMPKRKHGGAK